MGKGEKERRGKGSTTIKRKNEGGEKEKLEEWKENEKRKQNRRGGNQQGEKERKISK